MFLEKQFFNFPSKHKKKSIKILKHNLSSICYNISIICNWFFIQIHSLYIGQSRLCMNAHQNSGSSEADGPQSNPTFYCKFLFLLCAYDHCLDPFVLYNCLLLYDCCWVLLVSRESKWCSCFMSTAKDGIN